MQNSEFSLEQNKGINWKDKCNLRRCSGNCALQFLQQFDKKGGRAINFDYLCN